MAGKTGGKGQKIGRGSRSPSGKAYNSLQRWVSNKEKRIKRNAIQMERDARRVRTMHVKRGTARRMARAALQ